VREIDFHEAMNSIYVYLKVPEVCEISQCLNSERDENKTVFSFPPANISEVKIIFAIDYTWYNKSRRCDKWNA